MTENLEEYRTRAEGWLVEVVVSLDTPHGDLDAFGKVLERASAQLFQAP